MTDAAARPTRRVSDAIHETLRADIIEGRLAPGDALPSERTLAERHGVNRHAIREALKRLEQAGLVRIAQGGATRVQDWREHGGMDLLLDLVRGGDAAGAPPHEIVVSVLELRALIGVDAARRFAARADDGTREAAARLAEAVAVAVAVEDGVGDPADGDAGTMDAGIAGGGGSQAPAPGGPADPHDVVGRYEALWRAVVDGAGNLAYRLMLNSLNQAVAAYPELARALAPTDADRLRELAQALRAGDRERVGVLVAAQLEGDVPRVD